jgi:hypothetical protein
MLAVSDIYDRSFALDGNLDPFRRRAPQARFGTEPVLDNGLNRGGQDPGLASRELDGFPKVGRVTASANGRPLNDREHTGLGWFGALRTG